MAAEDKDALDAFYEEVAKAGMRVGGVRVSPKQRRTIAMQNATGAYARDRGPDKSTANQAKRRAPSMFANGRAANFKYMQGVGRAKGANSEDKKWARINRTNARWAINNDRERRGLKPAYKRGLLGGLKPVKKTVEELAVEIEKARSFTGAPMRNRGMMGGGTKRTVKRVSKYYASRHKIMDRTLAPSDNNLVVGNRRSDRKTDPNYAKHVAGSRAKHDQAARQADRTGKIKRYLANRKKGSNSTRIGAAHTGFRRRGVYKSADELRAEIMKAKPKTLYVYRPVENAEDIIAWAKSQGFGSTLAAADLHCTVAFSKTALNWAKLGDDYNAPDPTPDRPIRYDVTWSEEGQTRRKIEGGAREVKAIGDKGAVVLAFQSPALTERWAQFLRIGASWDYAGYTPHLTLAYKGGDVDLSKVEPYKGPIVLGQEDWNEIKDGAGENVPEVETGNAVKKALSSLETRVTKLETKPDAA